jgi:hypothetical protein
MWGDWMVVAEQAGARKRESTVRFPPELGTQWLIEVATQGGAPSRAYAVVVCREALDGVGATTR